MSDKKELKKPEPQRYTVKVETLVPATFIFNVVAENVDDAIKQTSRRAPNNIQYSTARRKNLKAIVCKQGTLNIVATKSFIK